MPQIRGINVAKETNQKNYIINGSMKIAQRGTSFVSPGSTYTLDRWVYEKSGVMTHTITQNTDAPTLAQSGYLLTNSLRMNLTGADTSIAATDFLSLSQRIEGFNFVNIAQKVFTLSFWVKATLTGTYCVSFRNSTADRSYVAEYTINTTDTWERKVITVLASPSAGTWNYTNGVGLNVSFVVAAGSNFQTAANSWQTGNFMATSNQVNGTNTGATDFRVTGVMVNEGPIAATFNLFAASIADEYEACQRYFEKSWSDTDTPGTNNKFYTGILNAGGGGAHGPVSYNVTKRAAAGTINYYNEGTINQVFWRRAGAGDTTNTINAARSTQYGFDIDNITLGSANQISQIGMAWSADAEL